MSISIVKIREQDIDFIKELELENKLGSWSKEDYFGEINKKNSINLIILEDKIKCGFLITRLIQTETDTEAEIYNLAIKESHRNNNLGTRLLKDFIKKGQKNNLRKIFLEVRETNKVALNFYKKNKFIEIGRRPKFYSNPSEDAILLCRTISI